MTIHHCCLLGSFSAGHSLWLPPMALHQPCSGKDWSHREYSWILASGSCSGLGKGRLQDGDRDRNLAMSICSSQVSCQLKIWSSFEHLRSCSPSLWFCGLDNYFHCQIQQAVKPRKNTKTTMPGWEMAALFLSCASFESGQLKYWQLPRARSWLSCSPNTHKAARSHL